MGKRPRNYRVGVLQERLGYLYGKKAERQADGLPVGLINNEIAALEWALPLLRAYLTEVPGDMLRAELRLLQDKERHRHDHIHKTEVA